MTTTGALAAVSRTSKARPRTIGTASVLKIEGDAASSGADTYVSRPGRNGLSVDVTDAIGVYVVPNGMPDDTATDSRPSLDASAFVSRSTSCRT